MAGVGSVDGASTRGLDEALRVERVLADHPTARTELVTLAGHGPLVRKRIPAELANPTAWAALMRADEPLLPSVRALYSLPGSLVVIYDYVLGSSLDGHVAAKGSLPSREAADVLRDVCHAAGALHGLGIVHRDVTPSNVILAEDGAHLVDLGIARAYAEGASHDTTQLGTWGFSAPEQFGFAQTDARSDVYSLGRLLAFMLTGTRPDDGAFESRLDDASVVPLPFRDVIAKACAFEPSSRYQTADELAVATEGALRLQDALPAVAGGGQAPERPTGMAGASDPGTSGAGRPATKAPRGRGMPWRGRLRRPHGTREWAAATISLLAVLLAVIVVFVGLRPPAGYTPGWRVMFSLFAIAVATFGVARPAGEACRSLLRRGPYEEPRGRIARLLGKVATSLALVALSLLVTVLVGLMAFGSLYG